MVPPSTLFRDRDRTCRPVCSGVRRQPEIAANGVGHGLTDLSISTFVTAGECAGAVGGSRVGRAAAPFIGVVSRTALCGLPAA